MLINRNNYEHFFLLYVDGELCVADRKATEDFASANPDLQQELNILKETVLLPEEIAYEGKSSLYKPVTADEMMQENLLLMVDNELPETERAAAFSLIAAAPEVATEYALLLRTKSVPGEQIIFADKHLLYRREKDNVVAGRFIKWAAAAVLLGFGLFFGITLLTNNKAAQTSVARVNNVPVIKSRLPELPAPDTQKVFVKQVIDRQRTAPANLQFNSSNDKTAAVDKSKKAPGTIVVKNSIRDEDRSAQEAPLIVRKDIPTAPSLKIIPDQQAPVIAVVAPKKTEPAVDNNIVPLENTYARVVSFNEEERSNNKILYMDEDDVKRSKAGGIFRKIKRFVERTAKIKTGNSLRIAGFEFAAK